DELLTGRIRKLDHELVSGQHRHERMRVVKDALQLAQLYAHLVVRGPPAQVFRFLQRLLSASAQLRQTDVSIDSRRELAGAERLDQVVVGTDAETFEPGLFTRPRRQQDD